MLKPEQVPAKAIEAFNREFMLSGHAGNALAAAINAWPGAERIYRSADEKLFTIILSLPTEASDDKA